MSEKRVRVGAGLRLGRRSKQDSTGPVERLGQRNGGQSHDMVADSETTHPPTSRAVPDVDIANVFKDPPASENVSSPMPAVPELAMRTSQNAQPVAASFLSSSSVLPGGEGNSVISNVFNDAAVNTVDPSIGADIKPIEGIDRATGNYLLTLGYPGSGKTVLQSFLYYYVATHGDYANKMERQRYGAQPEFLSERLLNTWLTDWSASKFPEATRESVEAIREIRLKLVPRINPSKAFNFSFVEVSGELIKSVVPTEVQAGSIVETMHNFLVAPKSKKIIVYVFDHKEGSNNDELFSSLIRYLERAALGNLDKLYSLMIVVPDPDFVLRYVSEDIRFGGKYNNNVALTPDALLHYLRVRAPQLTTTFRHWKKSKRGVFKFYVGPVQRSNDGRQKLLSADFADSRRIIEFCYRQFHGSTLKEGWMSRIRKALSS